MVLIIHYDDSHDVSETGKQVDFDLESYSRKQNNSCAAPATVITCG